MESLLEPNEKFDFTKLTLSSPININGGNHFIKYNYDGCPLYIKLPLCSIKQGIVSTSKRIFCDLMFTNENTEFIEYIENLEQYSQKYIFDNRQKWFETELEENDIENSFNSCMKIYKSGKYYCLRVSVPRILGKSNLKIYDENEQLVEIENIKEDDKVICALEVQGIKCSARSFQIEMEVKQMVLIKQKNIFEKCVLLKKEQRQILQDQESVIEKESKDLSTEPINEIIVDDVEEESPVVLDNNVEEENQVDMDNKVEEENQVDMEKHVDEENKVDLDNKVEEENPVDIEKREEVENHKSEPTEIDIEEIISSQEIKECQEPRECEIPLEQFNSDILSLKKKNDVYYEMYRKALSKAKMAKEMALNSFLEAKNIKNTYMLDDIDDSDLDDSISIESE
jgi:hypothetical protein